VARHREGLVAARDRFADLPVRVAFHSSDEPTGIEALLALADTVIAGDDPLDLGARRPGADLTHDGEAWF
jgi:hypothetical protein